MKNYIYVIIGILAFSNMAHAADKTDGISSSIAVQGILCNPSRVTANYTPSSDVNYKPGVDVNGNPVATADLNPTPQPTNATSYTLVPLNIDLARKLNLPIQNEMETNFGSLRVYNDGHVVFNGQDITSQANTVCGRTGAEAIQPMQQVPATNIVTMPQPDTALPGGTAPSATSTAR